MKIIEVPFDERNSLEAGQIIAESLEKMIPCRFTGARTETYNTVRYGLVTSSDFKPFFLEVPDEVIEVNVIILESGHGESTGGTEWSQGQATFRVVIHFINGDKRILEIPVKYEEIDYRRRWYKNEVK
jgi:hypothetical protein